jgi:CRISPR-associated protein Csd1
MLGSSVLSEEDVESGAAFIGRCLITGEVGAIARIHTKTPINKDCKSLVGLQKNSGYDSYGKSQAYNSPISQKAEAAYTTALKLLLDKGSKNIVFVGDATAVFWSEKKTQLEEDFFSFWSVDKDDPNRGIQAVETLLKSPFTGAVASDEITPFYVLGLSPGGGSRISVRFWHSGTVADFSAKIRQHFLDLKIVEPKNDNGSYALFFLLADMAVENKVENISPNLAGNIMRSIFTGGVYPATLLQQTVRRIRAEQRRKNPHDENVTRKRAALLKAYLNRKFRIDSSDTSKEEITVALDPENTNPGYRLGRLFAVLEKIQEDAQRGINATIRDRFYGAASSSPVSVFPQLLKLKNHHLSKLDNPAFRAVHEKRLTEIIGGLSPDMPTHLTIENQARFAIGYYHQRQAFYAK